MRTGLYATALLLCLSAAISGQQASKPARSSEAVQQAKSPTTLGGLGQTKEDVRRAAESSRLVPSMDQKEYFIVPKSTANSGPREAPSLWSFGDQPLSSKESVKVEIQVGTKGDKPVYLPVLVPRDQAGTASTDVNKLLDDVHWPSESTVQNCSDGKECARTCQDGRVTYCCQWKCKLGQ